MRRTILAAWLGFAIVPGSAVSARSAPVPPPAPVPSAPVLSSGSAEDGLPVRRVVLYKHGVGYFEREGVVEGRRTLSLRFREEHMGDVLKSLTVLDRGGGRIQAIAYDSQEPAEQLLQEFPFDLRGSDLRRSLLEQLRGAEVELTVAGVGVIRGDVVGVETRTRERDGATIERVLATVLTDDGAVTTVALEDLMGLRFTDEALAAEIGRYLSILRTTHRRDEKTVDLVCEGDGDRMVFAAYTVEQPVWKASYRLVLPGPEEEPLLQGWAIVDNPSDEDWDDVELSLVAGLPVSFRMDLYTPRFRERPLLVLQEDASVSFQGLEGLGEVQERVRSLALDAGPDRADRRRAAPAPPKAAFASLRAEVDKSKGDEPAMWGSVADSMRDQQAESVAREIGDLLEYRIDHRVTIPRQRSALLPIVSSTIEGRRVALYNEAARADRAMTAARLRNTSGVTLEGGPITVLEADTYAGESLLDTWKSGELRYVPFAIDLGIRATTEFGTTTDRVHRIEVRDGVLRSYAKDVMRKTYAFDNQDDEARTVMIEHPRRAGVVLREPEPAEVELDRYRFEVELAPSARGALVVVEEAAREHAVQVGGIDEDAIGLLQRDARPTPELLAFLRDVVAHKARIAGLETDRDRRDAELQAIAKDEERIRGNLSALGSSAEEKGLRLDYVAQLRRGETQVREVKAARADLVVAIAEERRSLAKKIASATFQVE